ncbi:hypothetical protein LEP1GSC058_1949 [Leptospira fainei serovar Hurstbridge str. BUT 6]|uniref:Uncharacterized protein n=1 Tax=Leptospira fainei serovar Hurstbridge str. BUT 6 TaxID=1193011 RepID=S3V2B6_9LEPT|nr:hypothetical protein [Leptospira fainei]EPG75533.1 hypothetical protein LEP1GSC058_1949 [Leptospira fainei serovar Hurstbridge str. BUT 6]
MKKLMILSMLLLSTHLFAFSEFEELLIKEATTAQLKSITKDYFAKKAKDHKELANRYQTLAGQSQGGKATASDEFKKKYKDLAEHCLKEAEKYRAQANKL